MDRRTSIKWMLAAAAIAPTLNPLSSASAQPLASNASAQGFGSDPDLLKVHKTGDFWPLTLTAAQRAAATALCDMIIPMDDRSPSASAVGVVDFIDEWVSAPYPKQRKDRPIVLDGLTWLDEQATRRFEKTFAVLDDSQRRAICDEICYLPKAKPELMWAATFFARFRDLTAGGFYTAPQGRTDLNYIGNQPRATFEGPPAELLKKLGLS